MRRRERHRAFQNEGCWSGSVSVCVICHRQACLLSRQAGGTGFANIHTVAVHKIEGTSLQIVPSPVCSFTYSVRNASTGSRLAARRAGSTRRRGR